ncbi:MAG: hypothetical protein ACKVOQ_21635 [Cyclobacteriaceae bacterium]
MIGCLPREAKWPSGFRYSPSLCTFHGVYPALARGSNPDKALELFDKIDRNMFDIDETDETLLGASISLVPTINNYVFVLLSYKQINPMIYGKSYKIKLAPLR